jgi:response regulator NasT
VAFENRDSGLRVKSMLEREGIFPLACAESGAGALRAALNIDGGVVVVGYKLPDMPVGQLATMVPPNSVVLVVAPSAQLDYFSDDSVFCVAAPVTRGDLAASVRMLMQMENRRIQKAGTKDAGNEKALVHQAKQLLMHRNHMQEDAAYRFMQKQSMNRGLKMADLARDILER